MHQATIPVIPTAASHRIRNSIYIDNILIRHWNVGVSRIDVKVNFSRVVIVVGCFIGKIIALDETSCSNQHETVPVYIEVTSLNIWIANAGYSCDSVSCNVILYQCSTVVYNVYNRVPNIKAGALITSPRCWDLSRRCPGSTCKGVYVTI